MPAADNSQAPEPTPTPTSRIGTELLGALRRHAGLAPPSHDPCTACAAPANVLVIGEDGRVAACDYSQPALRTGALTSAFEHDDLSNLRRSLAAGELPDEPCGTCASWLLAELQAPPLREYGALGDGEPEGPTCVVVRLPAREDLPAAVTAALPELLSKPRTVVIECADLTAPSLGTTLSALPDGGAPELCLRVGDLDAARNASRLDATRVTGIELTTDGSDVAALERLAAFAANTAADAEVRFVFTPSTWHRVDEVSRACADHGLPLTVAVLDRGGRAPLAALPVEELTFVCDALAMAWDKLREDPDAGGLARSDAERTLTELRWLLQRRAIREYESAWDGETHMSLPDVDHRWFGDGRFRIEWLTHLFGHAHLDSVTSWLEAAVGAHQDTLAEPGGTWLRVLLQRVAHDTQSPELLDRLRQLYVSPRRRASLVEADDRFAAEFDLARFGGPWAQTLGLQQMRPRARPFAISEPVPDDGREPDVTVLIPSFRHEQFIEETLRSVLAQDHAAFRVLVADDRSPDATVERARSVQDARVDVRVNEQNLGLGNSVLQALEAIDTPYVALLNSDDLFHPERLSRCCEVLDRSRDVQIVTTGMFLVDQDGGQLTPDNASLVLDGKKVFDWVQWFERVSPSAELTKEELFATLLEKNFLATSSNLVARTDWLREQAESLRSLKYCLDWQLFLQGALEGSLHHVHEPLIAYRLHASNTVWFREGRRWAYHLEVNRVAAEAVQRFIGQDRLTAGERLSRVVDTVTHHLATNSEMDGLALFLNAVLDPVLLDNAAAERPEITELIEELSAKAMEGAGDGSRAEAARRDARRAESIARLLHRLAGELLATTTDRRRALLQHGEELERRLRTNAEQRERLEQEKAALYQDQHERIDYAKRLEGEKKAAYDDLEQRIQRIRALEEDKRELHGQIEQRIERIRALEEEKRALHEDQEQRRAYAARLEKEKAELYADQARRVERLRELEADKAALYEDQAKRIARTQQLEGEKQQLHEDLQQRIERIRHLDASLRDAREERDARSAELEQRRSELAQATSELEQRRLDLAKVTSELDARSRHIEELQAALAAESAQVDELTEAKRQLESRRDDLIRSKVELEAEIEKLRTSREYRTGNFIWNKLPLAYMSRRGKKWFRRLVDATGRVKMILKRNRKSEGTAVVAACWQWPIYSHTFVYQEMVSLTHMGLDVRLFHWDLGDTDQLHAAFQYLYDNRTQLQPIWENHRKDKEHFDKTRPGRLRAFLERISPLCDKSVDELEKEPIVLQACTFARMAELANARYIHSYFFYDQSFMAMVAAWLLDLPRGVSCYADHMMDDYPWKFVPLHVELCDVIVATSARIKRELSELSGGKFDDKIVVKPNGVDGERFPARTRPTRDPSEPFEVLSVSRIEPKKGLTYLVEAIAMLKERGHKVIAHVIGSKDPHSKGSVEYSDEFESCIRQHGLEDQVILHGMMKQEQMPPIIEKCRAFVAPYIETESGDKDGIPTAMLEALASSLPVITTDSGSITEVIDDGVEGIIVPQRDSKAYAAALEKVITDPALEQRLAKAARARFDRDFDICVTEKRLHARVHGFLAEKAKA